MADRSHLTPVRTTDRRGRITTVYRNQAAKGASPGSRSLPLARAVPSADPSPRPASGPLREPSERTRKEMAEYLQRITSRWPGIMSPAHRILRTPEGRRATALAMDFVEDGALGHWEALYLLVRARPEDGTATAADALRVAAVLTPRAAELSTEHESWHIRIGKAVRGYRFEENEWGRTPVSSQTELNACLAHVEFVLHFDATTKGLVSKVYSRRRGDTGDEYTAVRNDQLARLVREHPADLDRIIAYVEEHHIDPKNPEEVHLLRAWLDGGIDAPLRRGWL